MSIFLSFLLSMVFFLLFWGFVFYALFYFFSSRRQPITTEEVRALSLSRPGLVCIGLSILAFNLFLYHLGATQDEVAGIGLGLFSVVFFASFYFVFSSTKRTLLLRTLTLLGMVVGLAFAFRANEVVQLFNLIVLWVCVELLFVLYILSHVQWEALWLLKNLWMSILKMFRHALVFLKALFQWKDAPRSQAFQVLKTVLLTFFVLVIFTSLLSQADPIFEELIKDFKNEAFDRFFFSFVLAAVLIFSFTFKVHTDVNEKPKLRFFGVYDVLIPVIALEVLFIGFLIVQARYLFGSHADLQAFDLTYSEYVRKGFIELLVTTFFASLIGYLVFLKQKTLETDSTRTLFQAVNGLLVVLLFALLASALKRDLMYVDVYGLTRIRIIGLILLGWLSGFLLLLGAITVSRRLQEKHLFLGLLMLSIGSFALFNGLNMDRMIAEATPPKGHEKDYFYISHLSEDAVEAWADVVLSSAEYFETVRTLPTLSEEQLARMAEFHLALEALESRRDALVYQWGDAELFDAHLATFKDEWSANWEIDALKAERHWTSANWSQWQAYQFIEKEQATFYGTLECMLREIEDYQINTLTDFYEAEWHRMYNYNYPFLDSFSSYYPQALHDLVIDTFIVDGYSEQLESVYGTTYPSYAEIIEKDEYGLLDQLQAAHTPDACLLLASSQ
jgi:hypothetical protein